MADEDADEIIKRLERTGDYKVLRRLDIQKGPTSLETQGTKNYIGIVVDVETTGIDPEKEAIIELAVRRFRFDDFYHILKIDEPFSWREDPERPLSPEIVQLTGLTDADLAGQKIDDEKVIDLLTSAQVVIAHNATFDRKFVEKRLPGASNLAWACSCREIDWPASGFDGRSLGWLLAQASWFHSAHRAETDVDAVIQLLQYPLPNGRTALGELMETATKPTLLIKAVGAHFDVKDHLKERGYRWDQKAGVWWCEIPEDSLTDEEFWLARNVYGAEHRAKTMGPHITKVTWKERYA